jgi:WhiB family redox-sensing transcriptional regulator
MDLHTELADLLAVPSFYKYANCKGVNQDDFFPERGSSTVIAKKICGECKVQSECLEYAVERKERFGIWGGKSERERRAIRRERRKNAESK